MRTFIDIHGHTRVHVSPPHHKRGAHAYTLPEQLIARYDQLDIECAVLLPGVNPECAHMPQSNEEILDVCRKYPGRFVPFCNIDPRAMSNSHDAPLGELMSYYRDLGCKGIGEVCANMPILHPMVQNLFKHAQKTGLPLTFHLAAQLGGMYGLYDEPGLPGLECSLQRFPKLKFLGHSQTFWAEIGRLETPGARYGYPNSPIREEGVVPKLMRRYPNLLGDLSAGSGCNALQRDLDYAGRFLDEFQDRLFFGTDISYPETPTPLVDLLRQLCDEKRISEPVFRKVARENAARLLEL